MTSSRVTILGGTGFVGGRLVAHLAERFSEVVVFTRRAQRSREMRIMPNVAIREVNIHDDVELASAVSGSDTVVNLVGILNESGSSTFAKAHDELAARVVAACESTGVKRYLHMSALNADASNGSSEYLKSKGRAEAHVRATGGSLAWTIFRPSVIFGQGDSFFNRFAGLLKVLPVFPLAVPGARMAPVWVEDVCRVMCNAASDAATAGQTIHLCGPDVFTLKELVEYTAETAELNSAVIGIPDWAAKLQARMMEFVPGKPFSRDNYLSLQTDSVCADDCIAQPTSVHGIVPRYLGKTDWAGKLQNRRASARR